MAVTKIWAIKDSLQRVLDYAANPDKTEYDALAQTLHYAENDAKTKLNESAQLVTGIHCRADHAWEDMRAVQERFGKTDGVVALHAYQSFREGEVTPEQCHEIGVALARKVCKVWGKRFQVLVATHMNTDNLHNHFVINSVSYVDGKKYEQRRSQYVEFRAASDKLCREYIDAGTPVLLWATIAMEAPVESTQFFLEDSGQLFTWLYPLHCLLLTGEDKDCYYFNDPLVGKNVAYPKEQVEAAYEGIGMQAVVLEGSVQ